MHCNKSIFSDAAHVSYLVLNKKSLTLTQKKTCLRSQLSPLASVSKLHSEHMLAIKVMELKTNWRQNGHRLDSTMQVYEK